MDYKYIEQLIERYFLAETTLQEEQILRTFFAQNEEEMPGQLGVYAPLFAAMVPEERLGDDFDKRMETLIGSTDSHQDNDGPVQVKARTISLADRFRPLFKAAAVVAILLTLGNAINSSFSAADVWTDDEDYAEALTAGDGKAYALEGVSVDTTALLGQVQLADSVRTDTLGLQR
ncbi:MAG: pyruvate ferredoxin oxidoreductase [Prevotella sp.]|jgi:hypothetical protein|nr:pyruvate ferredoxin oxidoreductase [Prevotella sp.]